MGLNIVWPIIFLLLLTASSAPLKQQSPSVKFVATHIAGSVYLIRAEGETLFDNVVASVGEDGILLVDTAYSDTEKDLRATLGSLKQGPVSFVVNSHYHHAGANSAFAKEATIIAHRNVRERMKRETKMYNQMAIGPWPELALPQIVFDQSLTLHFNGEEIHLLHFPNVHTDGDVVVFFKTANVVASGDFFVPLLGPCDLANGCSWPRFVDGIRRLATIVPKDAKIAPGHGPLSTYTDLTDFVRMIEDVTDSVDKQIKAGRKLEAIKAEGLPERWRSWGERGIAADFFLTNVYEGLTNQNRQP